MNIPNEVMRIFVKEAESVSYGKVSLGIIRRNSHVHYEIDKHITLINDGDVVNNSDQEERHR